MEKLHFGNGYELDLYPMGIGEIGTVLEASVEQKGTLTEMERSLSEAVGGTITMLSDNGETLRIYRGFGRLLSISKEYSTDDSAVHIRLGLMDELEERIALLEGAVTELADIVGGDD